MAPLATPTTGRPLDCASITEMPKVSSAIAFLTADLGADLGVMLSASHNPMPDNGIKFFARGGHKLDDAVEDAIEARMQEPWERPTGAAVGRIRRLDDGGTRYVRHLLTILPHRLEGLHLSLIHI